MKIRIMIILLFVGAISACAQDYSWQINLAGGDFIVNANLESLTNDSLVISQTGEKRKIAIVSIYSIQREKKSKFWQGALWGLLGGTALGGLVGYGTYEKPKDCGEFGLECFFENRSTHTIEGAAIGGLTGFALGGMIGVSAGADNSYDLSQKSPQQKMAIIKSILLKAQRSPKSSEGHSSGDYDMEGIRLTMRLLVLAKDQGGGYRRAWIS